GHLRQVARSSLLEQEREEVDLEEQVAELVEQLRVVAGERGIRDLVRLLDRVRDDGRRRLLPIPGAVAAQPLRQPLQLEKSRRRLFSRRHLSRSSSARVPSASWSSPARSPSGT